MSHLPDTHVAVASLSRFVCAVLHDLGMSDEHAGTAAWAIVEADLRGQRGHGVARLPSYAAALAAGDINPRPELRVQQDTPVSALVDGDLGLGHVVVMRAVETAIEKASSIGIGWVGTRRSTHAGAGGVYTGAVVERGFIACYLAVSDMNFMAPWGGTQRLLGTNPIAVAVPAGPGPHFELDMATAVASWAKVATAAGTGAPLPMGWVMDPEGLPLTDPHRVSEGSLVPIGEHKGYGLSLAVGLIAGVLNGAAFGRDVDAPASASGGIGQTILVVRPDLFRPLDEFTRDVDRHLDDLRRSAPRPGFAPVRTPGSRIPTDRQRMLAAGIPLAATLLEELRGLASAKIAQLLEQ